MNVKVKLNNRFFRGNKIEFMKTQIFIAKHTNKR